MAVIDITKDVKRMKEEIDYMIHMNQRLNLVLGYAMAFVFDYSKKLPECEKEKYYWLCEAVSNLIYLDKPLPPMP